MDSKSIHGSISLNPVPASRPRVTRWGTYYAKRYSTWKKEAENLLESGHEPFFGKARVCICLEFIVNKPKTTKRKVPIGDTDNYTKAALDALTKCGSVWADDDQVAVNVAEKRYADPGETPRTDYLIVEYPPHK